MKLESLKSKKFEPLTKSQMSMIYGGGRDTFSSGNVEITYQGKTYKGKSDSMSTDDNGKITCLEVDGRTIV